MSTLFWPGTLPTPSRVGYALQMQDAFVRSDMDAGPGRNRQKVTTVFSGVTLSFMLDQDQWAIFEDFFRDDLRNGSLDLLMPIESGVGIVNRVVKFLGEPAYDPSAAPGKCRASCNVEVREPLEMSMLEFIYTAWPGWIDELDHLVNVVLPDIWN